MKQFIYFIAIIATICFTSCKTSMPENETKDFLIHANKYKYMIMMHQDSLIQLQAQLIDELGDHLWFQHDCDNPIADSDIMDKIHDQEKKLNALYDAEM